MSAALFLRRSIPVTRALSKPIYNRCLSTNSAPTLTNKADSRRGIALFSAVLVSAVTYGIGAAYPPPELSVLFPRAAPAPPADPTSPESLVYIAALEEKLQTLPLLQKLRQREDAEQWYETRPYEGFPEERRVNNLTAGTLHGPGKLAVRPVIRAKRDESESIVITHLGRGLCGHDGIVHGGLLATLLDEILARNAINNLPERVGVTAQLSLNYRAPTKADQFVVFKTKVDEIKGRKVVVSGRVEDLDGTLLVEATAIFVQPRYAKLLNTAHLRQAMGEPPSTKEPILVADGEKLPHAHIKPRST